MSDITYNWVISGMDCAPSEDGLTNVVKFVHWRYQARDSGLFAEMYNSYPVPTPSPDEFVEYSNLTQEIVEGWLESNLDVGFIRTKLAQDIESYRQPPIVPLAIPWKIEPLNMEVQPVIESTEPTPDPAVEPTPDPTPAPVQTLEEMIADGYNPDARDGDGDGLVQDGTQWERPVDTTL